MAKKLFRLEQGARYRAEIHLGVFERHLPQASNEAIDEDFKKAGFFDVEVWGEGGVRFARGRWPGKTGDVELEEHIVKVEKLEG
jgi:hypothetical protein